MDLKHTIQDVADYAGVSKATVSRVINNSGYVGKKTKERVLKAIHELDFEPNEVARSISNNKTFLIGILVPTTEHPFFGEIVFYMERKLNKLGYKVMLCNTLNNKEKEKNYINNLMSNQVDGIIVGSFNSNNVDYSKLGLPIVTIDYFSSKGIPIVSSDNYMGGHLAVKELYLAGCNHIASINGIKKPNHARNERHLAYLDFVKEKKLKNYDLELKAELTREQKKSTIKQFLLIHPEIDGVFAHDDETAIHVIEVLKDLGKSVPHDVKVIGYDGTEIVRQLAPYLSTIQQPIKEMADSAVDILVSIINKEETSPKNKKLPVRVIKSRTTAVKKEFLREITNKQ